MEKVHSNTAKIGFSTNIVCIRVHFGTRPPARQVQIIANCPNTLHLPSRSSVLYRSGAKIHSNTLSNPVSPHCGAKMHSNTAKIVFPLTSSVFRCTLVPEQHHLA
ncbi:MAG: hypothetical protein JWR03_170 [Cohnella sp.]|nr:hypothetical protein [Cohnella sp.]